MHVRQGQVTMYLKQNPAIHLLPCLEVEGLDRHAAACPPVWTSRMLFFFSSYEVRPPCSALFPALFTILSPEKCERQPAKTSVLCVSGPAYTGCQQMAIFYHYYTIQRPFICGLGNMRSRLFGVTHVTKASPPLTVLLFVIVKLCVSPCVTFLTCTKVH